MYVPVSVVLVTKAYLSITMVPKGRLRTGQRHFHLIFFILQSSFLEEKYSSSRRNTQKAFSRLIYAAECVSLTRPCRWKPPPSISHLSLTAATVNTFEGWKEGKADANTPDVLVRKDLHQSVFISKASRFESIWALEQHHKSVFGHKSCLFVVVSKPAINYWLWNNKQTNKQTISSNICCLTEALSPWKDCRNSGWWGFCAFIC